MARQGRGVLTQEIKDKSKELLGYEIEKHQLRLLPYIQYRLLNNKNLDPSHLNFPDDFLALSDWAKEGHITSGIGATGRPLISSGAPRLQISKKFWDIMCELIYMAYVVIGE